MTRTGAARLEVRHIVIVPIGVFDARILVAPLASQSAQTRRHHGPTRLMVRDPPTRAQHGISAHELMGRRTRVHAGVVQNEIFDLYEFSRSPQGGAGVVEMRAEHEGFRHRAGAQALVGPRRPSDAASKSF